MKKLQWYSLFLLCIIHTNSMADMLAITGGTLIDVSHYGQTNADLENTVILIENGVIKSVDSADKITIPAHAKRIDAHGKYIVPGLIDGFGALKSQAFANLFLYYGVTSVLLTGDRDSRRGKWFHQANPSPHVMRMTTKIRSYRLEDIDAAEENPDIVSLDDFANAYARISNQELVSYIEEEAKQGMRVIWINYYLWPDQLHILMETAKRLGLSTIGETGWTSYSMGLHEGVQSFVHTQRYLSELIPPTLKPVYAANPFGKAGADDFHNFLSEGFDIQSPVVKLYGKAIAQSHTGLMPTMAMEAYVYSYPKKIYGDIPNPWHEPGAKLLTPKDFFKPLDVKTGASYMYVDYPGKKYRTQKGELKSLIAADQLFYQQGAKFLAASGTSAFGTFPGITLHTELLLFKRILGMSPREALATATGNYAEIMGWKDVGIIEPGRSADILVLHDDPRLDVAALKTIDHLVLKGQILDRDKLIH